MWKILGAVRGNCQKNIKTKIGTHFLYLHIIRQHLEFCCQNLAMKIGRFLLEIGCIERKLTSEYGTREL